MKQTAFIALALVLSQVGCVAIKEPRPNVVISEADRIALRNTVVGIMPPPVFIDTNRYENDFQYRRELYDHWGDVKQFYAAENLLHHLQYLDAFRDVDYTNRLTRAPDVVLIPRKSPPQYNEPWQAFDLVALGFVPLNYNSDDGIYFSSAKQPSNNYALPWPKEKVVWWFSPVLNMFPAWSRNSDTNAYKNALIFYLVHDTTNVFDAAGDEAN